jgi:AraC-like DNA-binding protein
MAIVRSVEHRL